MAVAAVVATAAGAAIVTDPWTRVSRRGDDPVFASVQSAGFRSWKIAIQPGRPLQVPLTSSE